MTWRSIACFFLNFNSMRIYILSVLVCCSFTLHGQAIRCIVTTDTVDKMIEINPDYQEHRKNWNKNIPSIIKNRRTFKNPNCDLGPIIIPIAFHFDNGLIPSNMQNCVALIIENQVQELNLELAGMDADASLVNNFASCFGNNFLGNSCIEFCLANNDHPLGYGLINGDPAITFGQVSFNRPVGNLTPVNSDWSGYMNVYIEDIGDTLGISNGIPGMFNGDGVIINNCVFGTGNIICPNLPLNGSPGCNSVFNEGETLAHEIGHYFGLYHIWADNSSCDGPQDYINDTPDMADGYFGYIDCSNHNNCGDLPSTCGTEDMYMNFMSSASDGCLYMFTSDQSDVINATAVNEGYTTTCPKCIVIENYVCQDDILNINTITQSDNHAKQYISSDAIAVSGTDILFTAENHILMDYGFEVEQGAVFNALIAPCENTEIVDVLNPITGQVWMDRNLGAARAAISSTDVDSYGDLYQWGRGPDGHQYRNSTITTDQSNIDQPGHGNFIITSNNPPVDWRNPRNPNLWQGINGINNPCPNGYRLPTIFELHDERNSWNSNDLNGAFDSPLKLPIGGGRSGNHGALHNVGNAGYLWSSTVNGDSSEFLFYANWGAGGGPAPRAHGRPVRCIKD